MTLDGKILRGLFEHERLKPTIIRTSQGNVYKVTAIKTSRKWMHDGITINNLQRQVYLLINRNSIKTFIKVLRKISFKFEYACISL